MHNFHLIVVKEVLKSGHKAAKKEEENERLPEFLDFESSFDVAEILFHALLQGEVYH